MGYSFWEGVVTGNVALNHSDDYNGRYPCVLSRGLMLFLNAYTPCGTEIASFEGAVALFKL